MSNFESFYGGRQGTPFVITAKFDGVDIPDNTKYKKGVFAQEEYNGNIYFIVPLIERTVTSYDNYDHWGMIPYDGETTVEDKNGNRSTPLPLTYLQGMNQCFAKGSATTSFVNYGEYVLIDTIIGMNDFNNPDNGKIFRRGFDGAEYIGQIAGPGEYRGATPQIEVDDYLDFDYESENPVQNKVLAKVFNEAGTEIWNEINLFWDRQNDLLNEYGSTFYYNYCHIVSELPVIPQMSSVYLTKSYYNNGNPEIYIISTNSKLNYLSDFMSWVYRGMWSNNFPADFDLSLCTWSYVENLPINPVNNTFYVVLEKERTIEEEDFYDIRIDFYYNDSGTQRRIECWINPNWANDYGDYYFTYYDANQIATNICNNYSYYNELNHNIAIPGYYYYITKQYNRKQYHQYDKYILTYINPNLTWEQLNNAEENIFNLQEEIDTANLTSITFSNIQTSNKPHVIAACYRLEDNSTHITTQVQAQSISYEYVPNKDVYHITVTFASDIPVGAIVVCTVNNLD